MKKYQTKEIDELFNAIMSLESQEEFYNFFEDVCTVKELNDMSQRLRAAKLLKNGCSYAEIARQTGMSTATISRVSRCLEYGNGGYRTVLEREAGATVEGDAK